MPLGMQVGLGPGDIVLDGDRALPERGTHPPLFCPCLLWPNGRPSQLLTVLRGKCSGKGLLSRARMRGGVQCPGANVLLPC